MKTILFKAFAICLLIPLVMCIASCKADTAAEPEEKQAPDPTTIYGTWQMCGVVLDGEKLTADNIMSAEEVNEEFNLEGEDKAVFDQSITFYEDGTTDIYKDIPDTEVGPLEQIDDNEYQFTAKGISQDAEGNRSPVTMHHHLVLKNGYLYLQFYTDDETIDDASGANVYEKAE